MGEDQELLDTARDFFQFVTRFFEVIKASAPHIYHSALELSPKSSIIQKHYHHQHFQDPKPRVLYGASNSWNQPSIIRHDSAPCSWSPCGQFFAVQTPNFVEVWDALTIEKCSDLQIPESPWTPLSWMRPHSPDMLAYSPEGHSLAGCISNLIIIWDIQTGGAVEKIEHGVKVQPEVLICSSDGTIICATFRVRVRTWTVVAYYVASGRVAHTTTLESVVTPCLWSFNNFLQVMTVSCAEDPQASNINILKIWPISNDCKIESFTVKGNYIGQTLAFSPSTYQICTANRTKLSVIDIQNSEVLLLQEDHFSGEHFSTDGGLLVARRLDNVAFIWKYTPGQGYSLWKKFPSWGSGDLKYYRFSPTSSSMLSSTSHSFEVQHFSLGTEPPTKSTGYWDELSTNGIYFVVTPKLGSTVTIASLRESSSQSLDTGLEIQGLALTGNILLVDGTDRLAAWRLTAEGVVDMFLGDGRGGDGGELWTKPVEDPYIIVGVNDGIGAIESIEGCRYYYDTKTGEELEPLPDDTLPSPWYWRSICTNDHDLQGWDYFRNNDFSGIRRSP